MPWRETPTEIERASAERPILVPSPLGTLFGILTPPDPAVPAAGICVVHLTRPRAHRNRMWVQGARHLAAHGFSAFRFDYHGTGDSGGDSAFLDPNEPYGDDVAAVLRHLRERVGLERFILTGSCFDARSALAAFERDPEPIEGLVFMAAPVMSLDDMRDLRDSGKDWRHVLRALRDPQNWRALGRAERWREMAKVIGRVAGRTAEPVAGAPRATPPLAASFLSAFTALQRSHARAFFLYGEEDPEFRTFQPVLRDLWPRLTPDVRARFVVEVWPGTVHGGFMDMHRQRLILDRVLDWVRMQHPGAGVDGMPPRAEVAPVRPSGALGKRPEGSWTSA